MSYRKRHCPCQGLPVTGNSTGDNRRKLSRDRGPSSLRTPDTPVMGSVSLRKILVNTIFRVICPPQEKSPQCTTGIVKSPQKQHQTLSLYWCSTRAVSGHLLSIGPAGDPATGCGWDDCFFAKGRGKTGEYRWAVRPEKSSSCPITRLPFLRLQITQ